LSVKVEHKPIAVDNGEFSFLKLYESQIVQELLLK